jgi:hypothetical protein
MVRARGLDKLAGIVGGCSRRVAVYNRAMLRTRHGSAARHLRGWLLGLLLVTASCGDDEYGPYTVVGTACRSDLDCAPGVRCLRGGSFPEGTCALPCRDHLDCTRGTACVDVDDGVCLVSCVDELYCRAGYDCKTRDNRNDPGESYVCIH